MAVAWWLANLEKTQLLQRPHLLLTLLTLVPTFSASPSQVIGALTCGRVCALSRPSPYSYLVAEIHMPLFFFGPHL